MNRLIFLLAIILNQSYSIGQTLEPPFKSQPVYLRLDGLTLEADIMHNDVGNFENSDGNHVVQTISNNYIFNQDSRRFIDSADLLSIKKEFNDSNKQYKILILPDRALGKNNSLLVKELLEAFALNINLSIHALSIDPDLLLKHHGGTAYYHKMADYLGVNALLTTSFEEYSTDSIISHVYCYYHYQTKYVVDSTKKIGRNIISNSDNFQVVYGHYENGNKILRIYHPVVFNKKEYYRGDFLNPFKCDLLRYFQGVDTAFIEYRDKGLRDSIRFRNLSYTYEKTLLEPNNVYNYKERLDDLTKYYNPHPLATAQIASQILQLDSLHCPSLIITALNICSRGSYIPTSTGSQINVDSLQMCIRRLRIFHKKEQVWINTFECIKSFATYKFYEALRILKYEDVKYYLFPSYNLLACISYFSSAMNDNIGQQAYVDSSLVYWKNTEMDFIIEGTRGFSNDEERATHNFGLYGYYLLGAELYFFRKDTSEVSKLMTKANEICNRTDSSQIGILIKNGFLKNPFPDLFIEFAPKNLHDAVNGTYYSINFYKQMLAGNLEFADQHLKLWKNTLFRIYPTTDSIVVYQNLKAIDKKWRIFDAIQAIGVSSFEKKNYSLCSKHLGTFYYFNVYDTSKAKVIGITYARDYFQIFLMLYKADYKLKLTKNCLYRLKTLLYYGEIMKVIDPESLRLWKKEIKKNHMLFRNEPLYFDFNERIKAL